ncbi:hypothetical protein CN324_21195 [Bacillus anthracis]|uniref:Winged helix-turn-helix transcriptional regulator n=1 Tax=Bacillus tropicus TaxID=2026188 RepID=A0A7T2V7D6_9BACI|nr:hypothetical protein B2J90_12915 [Bacillus cereus]PED55345.1 hypothetical protein CON50_08370 [Bacillus anthracis]PHA12507.1 hypothetical protein COE65_08960 [Bacillus sp. AFS051223]QPR80241.1 winged helix-turn-helix transcriptional regulator [Bacillus tropicus]PEF69835.1 hypothetical protein CON33_03365 [Bacillus anthracis]
MYQKIVPKVEYSLSEDGKSVSAVFDSFCGCGEGSI